MSLNSIVADFKNKTDSLCALRDLRGQRLLARKYASYKLLERACKEQHKFPCRASCEKLTIDFTALGGTDIS